MKSFLVKYHAPTSSYGSRMSVAIEGYKRKFYPYFTDKEVDCVIQYCKDVGIDWNYSLYPSKLPNGDTCVCLINAKHFDVNNLAKLNK